MHLLFYALVPCQAETSTISSNEWRDDYVPYSHMDYTYTKTGYTFKRFSSYAIVVALSIKQSILLRFLSWFLSRFLRQKHIFNEKHFAVWKSILSYVVAARSCKEAAILCSSKTYLYQSL